MPFVKLDCGIIHSSLWAEDSDTKICWITMLLLADPTGFVRAAASAIAREAGIPADVARRALELFSSPDDESRTPDNQGKRIEKIEGGYRILNYEKYRERDYTNAERQQRYRDNQKRNVTGVTPPLRSVTRNAASRMQKQSTDTDKEEEKKSRPKAKCTQKEAEDFCVSLGLPASDGTAMFLHWEEKGWAKVKNWQLTIRKWQSWRYLPSQKNGNSQVQRQMSAFEIEKRCNAISGEINKIWKRNGSKRAEGDGIDELKRRRNELQNKLVS